MRVPDSGPRNEQPPTAYTSKKENFSSQENHERTKITYQASAYLCCMCGCKCALGRPVARSAFCEELLQARPDGVWQRTDHTGSRRLQQIDLDQPETGDGVLR